MIIASYEIARKWLIVFNNVEDINDLNAYLPTHARTQGSVLITTQKSSFFPVTDVFKTIHIRNFSREESSDLLFKYLRRKPVNDNETETARQISDTLDGLPLAIATIEGYINESECSISEFLTNVRESSHAWRASAIEQVSQYEKTLETVFEIALKELTKPARAFLNILAFLNPDSIPEDLFISNVNSPSLDFIHNRPE